MEDELYFETEGELRDNLVATYGEEDVEEILPKLLERLPERLSNYSAQDVVDLAFEISQSL